MLTPLKSGFPHRHNANGTHDSICTTCFTTVASVQKEWELAAHESTHICSALWSHRYSRGFSAPYAPRAAISS
jgi:hypothetical protein